MRNMLLHQNPNCVIGLQLCQCRARAKEQDAGTYTSRNSTNFRDYFRSSAETRNPLEISSVMIPRQSEINERWSGNYGGSSVMFPRLLESQVGWSGAERQCSRMFGGLPYEVGDARQRQQTYVLPSLSREWAQSRSSTRMAFAPACSRALRPVLKDIHHQDSLFGNSFQSKSFFVVHPEWLSEAVDNTDPEPLHRPPWPWEQPRYRQNVQIPITYTVPEEENQTGTSNGGDSGQQCESNIDSCTDCTRQAGPIGYTFTQPGIDMTKPYAKMTQFGAPVVDTSAYKLSY